MSNVGRTKIKRQENMNAHIFHNPHKNRKCKIIGCRKGILDKTSIYCIYLASAGDTGGMMGKKFGFGWSFALPVIRQKEDIVEPLL